MRTTPMLVALAAAAALWAGCSSDDPGDLEGSGSSNGSGTGSNSGTNEPEHTALDDRQIDYNEALRTASLKLVNALPTLSQIRKVQNAPNVEDKKAAYEEELDAMFEDVRFQERMIKWWRDVMHQGGAADGDRPSRDTAPVLAARIVVEDRPYTDLFTATSNTCPSYDEAARAFVDGECNNNVPANVGVLTNPGVMHQFYGNMAFRRVRWVQEVFVCTKFPAEYSDTPVEMNGAEYVSPWSFESIATEPVDFRDTSSVICANCHTTMNHFAPLFGQFDENGMWSDSFQVLTPTTPDAIATELEHWLMPGEKLAWRLGVEVDDMTGLGQAIAADPDVTECAVARAWNFAMSKEDIVSDLATVPLEVIQPYVDAFNSNGKSWKETLRSIMKSDDFVKF
ncbi:MAG: DUF1588 domain-containing protein [Polyangiaceae bacterium]|nr:DUF1588 domain-containing protein [Polyangiaceae bacterium]